MKYKKEGEKCGRTIIEQKCKKAGEERIIRPKKAIHGGAGVGKEAGI